MDGWLADWLAGADFNGWLRIEMSCLIEWQQPENEGSWVCNLLGLALVRASFALLSAPPSSFPRLRARSLRWRAGSDVIDHILGGARQEEDAGRAGPKRAPSFG